MIDNGTVIDGNAVMKLVEVQEKVVALAANMLKENMTSIMLDLAKMLEQEGSGDIPVSVKFSIQRKATKVYVPKVTVEWERKVKRKDESEELSIDLNQREFELED